MNSHLMNSLVDGEERFGRKLLVAVIAWVTTGILLVHIALMIIATEFRLETLATA